MIRKGTPMLKIIRISFVGLAFVFMNALPVMAQECWEEVEQDLNQQELEIDERVTILSSFWEEITLEQIKTCLNNGADVNARDWVGATPLHEVAGKSFEVISLLLKAGADLNARSALGGTPLHQVAKWNRDPKAIIALLDAGADLHARDDWGNTPLHNAANINHNPEVIVVLLNAGADVHARNRDDWQGRTPIHEAADGWDNSEVIIVLLEAGADVNARDKDGRTPLHLAVFSDAGISSTSFEYIPILLKAGVDVNARDKDGKTALYYASKNEFVKDTKEYWALHDAQY